MAITGEIIRRAPPYSTIPIRFIDPLRYWPTHINALHVGEVDEEYGPVSGSVMLFHYIDMGPNGNMRDDNVTMVLILTNAGKE